MFGKVEREKDQIESGLPPDKELRTIISSVMNGYGTASSGGWPISSVAEQQSYELPVAGSIPAATIPSPQVRTQRTDDQ